MKFDHYTIEKMEISSAPTSTLEHGLDRVESIGSTVPKQVMGGAVLQEDASSFWPRRETRAPGATQMGHESAHQEQSGGEC